MEESFEIYHKHLVDRMVAQKKDVLEDVLFVKHDYKVPHRVFVRIERVKDGEKFEHKYDF